MMNLKTVDIIYNVDQCLIPKLAKNVDECAHHAEYEIRNKKLDENFNALLTSISDYNLRDNLVVAPTILSALYVLYKDLLTEGPWHTEKLKEYAQKLNSQCDLLYEITLESLLTNDHMFNKQIIFDESILMLHHRLSCNDFKKHPSLIDVYCSVVEGIQNYKNVIVSVKALPVCLYLIDDYLIDNKKKGLNCCRIILENLPTDTFAQGNYYEVIYACVKKVSVERDLEITRLVVDCLIQLLISLPNDIQFKYAAADELYGKTLEQILTESNLYRKAVLFNYTRQLIMINGVNCVGRKAFHAVINENLDISCNDGVKEILLQPVVECLEEWILHCWCAWRLNTGRQVLSILFKILYICSKEDLSERIVKIIATLILLCEEADREKIMNNLQKSQINNKILQDKVNMVNKYVSLNKI
ncbi:uncharacterized protein LOC126369405 [Pectinophora gossypiella]|uniref:uncharacterized protein LOC126369405 n=1 Tax=Pectinophora gossypiella TaxID=13191 RepID=UPI00214EDD01|nr:uncharacterized protein LOC126369405 [Pectinophora gossypiella]